MTGKGMNMIRTGRYAFSLVELLVVVAIIALLISIMLPSLSRAQEKTRQTICMSNLKGIDKAWRMYTSANRGMPPILPDIGAINGAGPGPDGYSAWKESLKMGGECTAASLDRGAQQNLCLLVKIGALDWGMFLCPSTGNGQADRGAGRKFGLGETDGGAQIGYCDYAIQAPYRYGRGTNRNRCPITKYMDDGVVILADRGPRRWYYVYTVGYWSQNHPDDGENILYAGGHVRFASDTAYDTNWEKVIKNTSGWDGNCIYTPDRWDTSDPENPILLYNGTSHAGGLGNSTKDTALFWWPEEF